MNYGSKDTKRRRRNYRSFIHVGQKVKGYRRDGDDEKWNNYTGIVYSIDEYDEKNNPIRLTIARDDGGVGTGNYVIGHDYDGERGWSCSIKAPSNQFGSDGYKGELSFLN